MKILELRKEAEEKLGILCYCLLRIKVALQFMLSQNITSATDAYWVRQLSSNKEELISGTGR